MLRNAQFYLHRISIEPLFFNFRPKANMLFQTLATLLSCMLTVQCKVIKSIPSITGSLVNLGKMDISFHFNSKDLPPKVDNQYLPLHSFLFPKPAEPIAEEPCQCTGLRSTNNFLNEPSELLNKVLMSNDLFSYNKDPVSSTMCCGSHEHAQEDVLTFEFGPKTIYSNSPSSKLPNLPFLFENLFPRKPFVSSSVPTKQKAVEIFLLPKKSSLFPIKKDIKKDAIQIVGDKELRNDFNSLRFRPSIPINLQSSVKKDLTAQEKNENDVKKPHDVEEPATTVGNVNAI